MKDVIKSYLTQGSTYKGLALLLSMVGVAVAPEQLQAVGIGISAAIGLYETLRNEHKI